jgi:hypothetical protein
MPDWEAELTALLHALDVRLERDTLASDSASDEAGGLGHERDGDLAADLALYELGALSLDLPAEQLPVDGDEVSAVRHEIEATLARVVRLTRSGQLDPALRDDVVFVLQALTRPRPAAPAAERDEWQLASAAAILHFCRVVHRLTSPLESDAEF